MGQTCVVSLNPVKWPLLQAACPPYGGTGPRPHFTPDDCATITTSSKHQSPLYSGLRSLQPETTVLLSLQPETTILLSLQPATTVLLSLQPETTVLLSLQPETTVLLASTKVSPLLHNPVTMAWLVLLLQEMTPTVPLLNTKNSKSNITITSHLV